jgi:hypothetical protein
MHLRTSFVRLLALAAFLTVVMLPAFPSMIRAADHYPDDAVVVSLTIDPSSLSEVRTVAELAEVLQQELSLEAASPLDFEVVIHIAGNVYQNRDQQAHQEGSGIMVSLENGDPVKGRVREMRFHTYGDFSESEAWKHFSSTIQEALLYSMNSSGAFEVAEDGNVWLTVTDVVDGTQNAPSDGASMVLELTADMLYRDGSKFGSKEPPEGYRQVLRSIQLVLSPAVAQVVALAEEESAEEAPAVVAETDGITGVYGYEQSGYRVEIKDGRHVMSDIRKNPPEYIWFTPVGENAFSAEMFGESVEISFSGDDQGHATEMSIKNQGSNGFQLPLKESAEAAVPRQGASLKDAADTPAPLASPAGITGTYGVDRGAVSVQEVDGQLAMSNPNAAKTEHWPLEEIGQNRYSSLFNGNPVELKFSIDDDGQAFAVTIIQGDREMKIPRKEAAES